MEFEFKWEVLGMGYEMSQCECETVACMVFESRLDDKLITTVFTKDNLSLKKSTVTQQTIVLTENTEQLFDPKVLKPLERPAKREVEDIFGDMEADYTALAELIGTNVEFLKSSARMNFPSLATAAKNEIKRLGLFSKKEEWILYLLGELEKEVTAQISKVVPNEFMLGWTTREQLEGGVPDTMTT